MFALWLLALETLVVSNIVGAAVGSSLAGPAWGVVVALYMANFALSLVYVLRRRGGTVQEQQKELLR